MNEKDLQIARKLKKEISKITQVLDFKVFGSRAKGQADEYSDMDVFIEVPYLDNAIKEQILEVVWQVGFDNYLVISPLIFTKEEIEQTALRSSPIVKNISREGIAV